jgi:hypothetical protein
VPAALSLERSSTLLKHLRTRIRKHEVGLWFRHGDFKRPLTPGRHWVLSLCSASCLAK